MEDERRGIMRRGQWWIAITCCLTLGCGAVREDYERAQEGIKTAKENTKRNLKNIQIRGQVEIETLNQLNAIREAYDRYHKLKPTPPVRWNDLVGLAQSPSNVQDAQRNNAYLRFGVSAQDLADPDRGSEILAAVKNIDLDTVWAARFDGEIVTISDSELSRLLASQSKPER
jgi:hypothetical protein